MIRISFKYDSEGIPTGIWCLGHAGADVYGKDIVCAAVSALIINTWNSVEAFTDDDFKGETNEEKGYFLFELAEPCSDDSKLLMRSLEMGLRDIQKDNRRYISFIDWEVKSC